MLSAISFYGISQSIHAFLSGNFSAGTVTLIEMSLAGFIVINFFAVLGLFMVYMERKVSAFMQFRLGPMRVGYMGTAQTLADTLKLLLKEDLTPKGADRLLFNLAPILVIIVAMLAIAPIAFAPGMQLWNINIGVLYISAISSLGVIGILMAGWSSNNKYSLLGAMRSGAQLVSYELSVGLSLVTAVIFAGSLNLTEIIQSQQDGWWIFKGHIPALIAFSIFIIASTAETNRAPFDMVEAESELTAGFHTEYSGMKFALFFLAEYGNVFVAAAVASTLFLGGWMPFHIGSLEGFNHIMDYIPGSVWFAGKTLFIIFLIMWFRWTFPRLRIDQLLTLEWKYLLPISLFNLLLVSIIVIYRLHF